MSAYNLPSEQFTLTNVNSIGSQYAQDYAHNISLLVQKLTKEAIFDASPKQFFDLKMLAMKPAENYASDEFFYKEAGYQRTPLIATGTASAVSYPATQTFSVASTDNIAVDFLINYPDQTIGNVIAVDSTAGTVTVRPMTNGTLPAVAAADNFSVMSSIEGDGRDGFANYYRMSTIERFNYIQLFSKAIRYGDVELYKMQKNAIHPSFLSDEMKMMFKLFRLELSNAFWNGQRGEMITSDGTPAKMTQGIFPAMVAAGSPNVSTPISTVDAGLKDIALNSEFGDYGQRRFLFARNEIILAISEKFKTQLTRYTPNDMVAKLNLDEVNIGSTSIVLVPHNRFGDASSFPAAWRNRAILLDPENITTCQLWGQTSGETLSSEVGKTYKDTWVRTQFGVKYNNPLACAWMDITGI